MKRRPGRPANVEAGSARREFRYSRFAAESPVARFCAVHWLWVHGEVSATAVYRSPDDVTSIGQAVCDGEKLYRRGTTKAVAAAGVLGRALDTRADVVEAAVLMAVVSLEMVVGEVALCTPRQVKDQPLRTKGCAGYEQRRAIGKVGR